MALRWYTTVVDAHDVRGLAAWWAETLGWHAALESDDEVVLVPAHVTPDLLARTPWEQVGPGLVFVAVDDDKRVKNRLHLDLAPHLDDDRDALVQRLLDRGASRVDVGQPNGTGHDVLADPEGNEFCVLSARDR